MSVSLIMDISLPLLMHSFIWSIKVDTIEDIQPVTVNGKLKLRILFREGEDMKYALIGTIFIDQINECIKSGNEISIIRDTDTLRTYVECH